MVSVRPTTREEDAQSLGLPPTYEESLQHRTIETGTTWDAPPMPLVPEGVDTRQHRHYGNSFYPMGRDLEALNRVTDTPTTREDDHCSKLVLPPMHMCMATVCLVFNVITPGIGTIIGGFGALCCTNPRIWTWGMKIASCVLCFFIGIFQLILTPVLLLGWVWSILWGFAFIGASAEYHRAKIQADEERRSQQAVGPEQESMNTTVTIATIGTPSLSQHRQSVERICVEAEISTELRHLSAESGSLHGQAQTQRTNSSNVQRNPESQNQPADSLRSQQNNLNRSLSITSHV